MNLVRLLVLPFLLWHATHAEDTVDQLRPGEALTYRVGWGLLSHVGDLKIGAEEDTFEDEARLRLTSAGATRGLARFLYPFRGVVWTSFDPRKDRLMSAAAVIRTRKKNTHVSITFDYDRGEADYLDHLNPARSATLPIPAEPPIDIVTALVRTRGWGLAPGQTRSATVLFDDDFYSLQITAEREETISTPQGKRRAVLLIPRMVGKPKGLFSEGGNVRVWVAADGDRLPLRFEVELNVGTAFAVLTDYRPPEKK